MYLIFPFDSPPLAVSNRPIVMVPQNSTGANGKTVSIPDLASHARAAGIEPGQATLCVDPFPVRPPRLKRAFAKPVTPPVRRMRKLEHAMEFVSIVGETCSKAARRGCSTGRASYGPGCCGSGVASERRGRGGVEYSSSDPGRYAAKPTRLARFRRKVFTILELTLSQVGSKTARRLTLLPESCGWGMVQSDHTRTSARSCVNSQDRRLTFPFLCALGLLLQPMYGATFPVDEFKAFVNKKPTIESFDFKVNSTKYSIRGLDPKQYRRFNLVMQDAEAFRLIEDRSEYVLRVPSSTNQNKIIDYRPIEKAGWARFGNQICNTFNSNRVNGEITTVVRPEAPPDFGPARMATFMIRVAYDALDLGLLDLGDIGVTWSGDTFVCRSNLIGNQIKGHLELGAEGTPQMAVYTIEEGDQRFQYRARYSFSSNSNMPKFFPSRITVENLQASSPTVVSDYEILSLRLSDRQLSQKELALYPDQAPIPRYVYTNHQFFRSQSNSLVLLTASTDYSGVSRRYIVLCLLIAVLGVPPSVVIYRLIRKRNMNK